MDERITPMATTEKLVADGMKKFASAERGLKAGYTGLLGIAKVFEPAYTNGDIKGGAALKRRDRAIELAGKMAAIHSEIISFHEECTADAQAAGKDQPGDYAELPPLNPDVITPKSGGR